MSEQEINLLRNMVEDRYDYYRSLSFHHVLCKDIQVAELMMKRATLLREMSKREFHWDPDTRSAV